MTTNFKWMLWAMWAFFGLGILAGPHDAYGREAAPIRFAAQAQPAGQGAAIQVAALETGAAIHLTGGDDASYGYGRPQPQTRPAPIDLRRAPAPRPAETRQEQAAAAPWLDQERLGPPYQANGRWYMPTAEPSYSETGTASWYGPGFHGRQTATGETYDENALTAAHPTLPLNAMVQVTNLDNGRDVLVRINDRGPFVDERLIDMSRKGAQMLGFEQSGTARVSVRYVGPAGANAASQSMAAQNGPRSLLPPEATARFMNASYAPAPVAAPMGSHMVQVGAFADIANAHRVQSALAGVGPVEIDIRQTARGDLFRVRIGPFPSEAAAQAAAAQVENLGFGQPILASR